MAELLDYTQLSEFMLRAMRGDARAAHELEQRAMRDILDKQLARAKARSRIPSATLVSAARGLSPS